MSLFVLLIHAVYVVAAVTIFSFFIMGFVVSFIGG